MPFPVQFIYSCYFPPKRTQTCVESTETERTIENVIETRLHCVFVSCIISSLFCSSYFFLIRFILGCTHTHTHTPAVIETVFLIETKGLRFLCNSFDPYQWCVFHMLWNPHLHHLPHPTDPIYFPSASHLTLLRTRTECSVNKPTFTSCIYNDTDTAAVSLFTSCKTPVPLSLSLGWSASTQFASLTVTIQCGTDLNWRI